MCVGEIRGTFHQYFKCLPCEGVAGTLTILRSCFNEAAVATLLITRLNCQRFTLKRQLVQEASAARSFFVRSWRLSSCRVSLMSSEARASVWRRLALHPSAGVWEGGGGGVEKGLRWHEVRSKNTRVCLVSDSLSNMALALHRPALPCAPQAACEDLIMAEVWRFHTDVTAAKTTHRTSINSQYDKCDLVFLPLHRCRGTPIAFAVSPKKNEVAKKSVG